MGQNANNELFDGYDLSSFYYGSSDDLLELPERYHNWHLRAIPEGYHLYSQPVRGGARPMVQVHDPKTEENRDLINLSSYNYLGIAHRPEVIAAAAKALETYGLGSAGSPVLSGTMDIHEQLAIELSEFKKKESTVIFPSGYSANLGFISALMRHNDTILCDHYAHASSVDGAILAQSKTVFFRHNNAADLRRKLREATGRKLIVVEGVYSMDGDVCALPDIVAAAEEYGAYILIDEAHSSFLYGDSGRGVAEQFGLEDRIHFHLGTFSKTLGGQGGFVSCSAEVADYVTAYGKSRLFSCNLAPPVAAGVLAGLRIVRDEPQLREILWRNVTHLRGRLLDAGVNIGRSTSQVIPVMINDDVRVFGVAAKLQERGLFVPPVTYPAVAMHKSRLRIAVSSAHTIEQLDTAATTIIDTLREESLLP